MKLSNVALALFTNSELLITFDDTEFSNISSFEKLSIFSSKIIKLTTEIINLIFYAAYIFTNIKLNKYFLLWKFSLLKSFKKSGAIPVPFSQ